MYFSFGYKFAPFFKKADWMHIRRSLPHEVTYFQNTDMASLAFSERKQVFLKKEARLVLSISERKQTVCISGDLEWLGADTERPGLLLVASRRSSTCFLINVNVVVSALLSISKF